MLIASVYGVVRETVKFEDGVFSLGLQQEEGGEARFYKKEWMHAGTWPLMMVVNAEQVNLHWGLTYATVVTNFVPRAIWPEKPPPGGVVFTNEYAPGFYDEYSHFASGLYPEAIMNFGKEFGVIFGSAQLFLLCYVLSRFCRRITRQLARNRSHFRVGGLCVFDMGGRNLNVG